jgi:acyl carrier protein
MNSIEHRIRTIITRLLPKTAAVADPASEIAQIGIEKDIFRDLGIKSSSALELLLSLEDEFGRPVADEEFNEARTIAALTRLFA